MTTAPSPRPGTGLTLTLQGDREVVLARTFAAPRPLVWEACTRPEHIARWWGMRGSTMAVCEVDLRPGGSYRFVLRSPDGREDGFHGEYREIAAPERVVQTFIYEPFPDSVAVETMTLTEADGTTMMVVTTQYPSAEVRDMVIGTGMEAGAAESYDRLAELLATLG